MSTTMARPQQMIARKKSRKSTILTRNMGSLRRCVQYYGSGTVPMKHRDGSKRTIKPVHGVTPTLSISKSALYSFADLIGQFQVAVTRNAAHRPSKKANASLTAGDIQDGFKSFCGDFYHYLSNKMAPSNALLMGKDVQPLPLKRTMDIIKSVVRGRRVTKKAVLTLNEYAFNVALHMIKVAGDRAAFQKHARISLDDFMTVYGLETYGLHKIRLEKLSVTKKKSPSTLKAIKIYGNEDMMIESGDSESENGSVSATSDEDDTEVQALPGSDEE